MDSRFENEDFNPRNGTFMMAYLTGMHSRHCKIAALLGLVCGFLLLGPTHGLAQSLDMGGWQIVQENSSAI